MKLVIFDCDGTIVDSQHIIVAAMNQGFEAQGLVAPERGRILSIVGLSLPTAVAQLMPGASEAAILAVTEGYKSAFGDLRRDPAHHEPVFEGLLETIETLAARDDVLLGIATGKSRRGVDALLVRTGLGDHFVTIQTADGNPSKPSPVMIHKAIAEAGGAPERTVMIGDTTFDMQMALAARVNALGVGWGYHPVSALRAVGAHAIADEGAALVGLVDQLLGAVSKQAGAS